MAAIVPTSNTYPGTTNDRSGRKLGKCRRFDFDPTGGGADTWTSGIRGITGVAWEGADSTNHAAPTYDAATTVITLNAAGAVTGTLLVWSKN